MSELLAMIQEQIQNEIEKYPNITTDDIQVFIKNDKICFCANGYLHEETKEELQTAYMCDIEINGKGAVRFNVSNILCELNEFIKNCR